MAFLRMVPLANGSLSPDELNTFIGLLFSPFLVIASLTTFVVGWSALLALYSWDGASDLRERIEGSMAFGTVRAFLVSIPPAAFLLFSTIKVYT